jgi:apolipoprotein N-acyltransferase
MKAVAGERGVQERFLLPAAAAAGFVSSAFGEKGIGLTGLWSLLPLLWLEAESRRSAFLTAFVFYLSLSRGIVPGAAVFFRDGSLIRAFALWVSSAAALALPWGLLWSPEFFQKRSIRIIAALLISIPPPLGVIGWGNPLTAAGLFFPGFGWYGLTLMLLLYAAAAVSRTLRRALIVLVLLVTPFLSFSCPPAPEEIKAGDVKIRGLNTSFGRMASGSGDFDAQYERERAVFRYIREMEKDEKLHGTDIVVLPETIIGRMNPTTLNRWEKFFESLALALEEPFAEKGTVFIAGAEIPTHQGMKYDNTMVSFGEGGKRQAARQRFPVPFSMYMPFRKSGANGYLSSLGDISMLTLRGKRLGVLICYEQFLTWPFLTLLPQKPDALLAPSNLWWCENTSLPGIQAATVRLWARLFGIPTVVCANR